MITTLTLGTFTFTNFEIPENINFGGTQSLAVKKLIGGQRVIDAMGRDDHDITWSGLFQGTSAQFRAQFLDQMRVSGTQYPLTWSIFNYLVVIKDFSPSFERQYWIPYSITVTVIQDLNKPIPILFPVTYNDAISNLLQEANDLAFLISNPSITSALALLSAAILLIPSIQDASTTTLIPVLAAIESALSVTVAAVNVLNSSVFS